MKPAIKYYLLLIVVLATMGNSLLNAQPIRFNNRYIGNDYEQLRSIVCYDNYYWIIGNTYNQAENWEITCLKIDSLGNELQRKIYVRPFFDYYTGWMGCTKITADGGFILAGSTQDTTGNTKILLAKFTADADTQWTKQFDFNQFDIGYSVIQTVDKGYAIVCTSDTTTVDNISRLIKTDSLGNFLWTKTYAAAVVSAPTAIAETDDKGFCMSGSISYQNNSVYLKQLVIKTDSLGNQQWLKKYSGGGEIRAQVLI